MNKTKIEWTDFTSNPWRQDCRHGCWYCYAGKISKRFGRYKKNPVTMESKEIDDILRRKKPAKIFIGSMTDLFGDWVPSSVIKCILRTVELSNIKHLAEMHIKNHGEMHTFQFLTKNPERYLEFDFPVNCWLGATATNQAQWDRAISVFSKFPKTNIHFISCEPLLSEIKIRPGDREAIDWLIIGALTGKGAAKHKPRWLWIARLISGAPCAVFLKDNLGHHSEGGKIQEYPKEGK